jgi:hypothetical protein
VGGTGVFAEVVVTSPLIEAVTVSHVSEMPPEYGHTRCKSLCPEADNTNFIFNVICLDFVVHQNKCFCSLYGDMWNILMTIYPVLLTPFSILFYLLLQMVEISINKVKTLSVASETLHGGTAYGFFFSILRVF